jgi:glycerate 2-kinase
MRGAVMQEKDPFSDLSSVFHAAVKSVDPYELMQRHLSVEKNSLTVETGGERLTFDLEQYTRVFVIGAGKATAKMAKAVEEMLGNRITEGVISVKYGHTQPLQKILIREAGHPVPDQNGIRAAQEIERIARRADAHSLVINLISGGGSALLTSPLRCVIEDKDCTLGLDDFRRTTQVLLACGATIEEMNCIRKHISMIKGGRLARMIEPAVMLNFILSDVVGDRLDTIASGLTTFDDTTFSDAVRVVSTYGIRDALPEKVVRVLDAGEKGLIEETPKKVDPLFSSVKHILIGTNLTALRAGEKHASTRGYNTRVLSSRITGEASEIAQVYYGIARDVRLHDLLCRKPACILGGGETTVTLHGHGKGGRNQECALSFLSALNREKDSEGIFFLSAATDGNDGPTDAAGAFACAAVLKKSTSLRLNIEEYLQNNDSYTFYEKTDALLKTGPTNTNVCDIQIVLVV